MKMLAQSKFIYGDSKVGIIVVSWERKSWTHANVFVLASAKNYVAVNEKPS